MRAAWAMAWAVGVAVTSAFAPTVATSATSAFAAVTSGPPRAPRRATVLFVRCDPRDEDFDPLETLALEGYALMGLHSHKERERAVRRAYAKAAFRYHPDTAEDGAGDCAAPQRVQRAARELGSAAGIEAALKLWLRAEVELWTTEQLADFLHARNPPVPDHVVDAFVEEGVCGHMIVGDYRFAGDDVEHIVWTLRFLGTKNEVEAMQVEDAIRTLAGWTDGGKSFKRRPGLRQIGAARRVTNSR